MDEKTIKEFEEVVKHANHGNWFPFAIVCVCLGLIVLLFIYILKMKEKQNGEKHKETKNIVDELVKGNFAMNTIIAVHENEIKNLKTAG